MLLCELFSSGGDMMERLRQNVLDFITPLLGQDLPFVTIQQIIDKMRHLDTGITVDRALIMEILNPDEIDSIDKIEGDRVYFKRPEAAPRETSEEDKEKDKELVKSKAQKQAKKKLK